MLFRSSGNAALEKLSRASGGVARLEVGSIWKDMMRQPRLISLTPWLLIVAALLMLVEVIERRTGLVTLIIGGTVNTRLLRRMQTVTLRKENSDRGQSNQEKVASIEVSGRSPSRPTPGGPAAPDEPAKSQPPITSSNEPAPSSLTDALSQARKQARTRTENRGD